MAAGIDAEGHLGALEGSTPTYAVLGSGVDVCYPAASRGIYRRIPEKGGGIISEYEPGTKAGHIIFRQETGSSVLWQIWCWSWKQENESGSLITARLVLWNRERHVYARYSGSR